VSPDGSVTDWLGPLRAGDAAAVRLLWERYFHRLVDLARRRLRGAARGIADEEDVALSAFDSFCRRAAEGGFPGLLDRDGLWRLLMTLTARKAARQLRDAGRRKRGGAAVVVSGDAEAGGEEGMLAEVMSREPSPEMAAEAAEEYRRLLNLLGDKDLEAIAVARMEGCGVEEIATRVGFAPRSVKRKLRLIRDIWQGEVGP
jgi:DNA-directed RNA polymerase specialized sigma24 family protein